MYFGTPVIDTDSAMSVYSTGSIYYVPPGKGGMYLVSAGICINICNWAYQDLAYISAVRNADVNNIHTHRLSFWTCQAAGSFYVELFGTTIMGLAAGENIMIGCGIQRGAGPVNTVGTTAELNYFSLVRIPGS
jgi:hypothetical protein